MKKLLILVMLMSPAFAGAVDNLPPVKVNGDLTLQDDSVLDTRLTAVEQSTGTLYDEATEQFTQVAIDTTTIASSIDGKVSKTGDTMSAPLLIKTDGNNYFRALNSTEFNQAEIGLRDSGAEGYFFMLGNVTSASINGPGTTYDFIDTGRNFTFGSTPSTHKLNVAGGILATSSITATGGLYSNYHAVTNDGQLDFINSNGITKGQFTTDLTYGTGLVLSDTGGPAVRLNYQGYPNRIPNPLVVGPIGATHSLSVSGDILATSSITANAGVWTDNLKIDSTIGYSDPALHAYEANSSGYIILRDGSQGDVPGVYLAGRLNDETGNLLKAPLGIGAYNPGTHKLYIDGGVLATSSITANEAFYSKAASTYAPLFKGLSDNGSEILTMSENGTGGAYIYVNNASGTPTVTMDGDTGKIEASTSFMMGYERVSNSGTNIQIVVDCTAGKKIMGGGCQTDGTLLESYPYSDTGYTCVTSASATTTAWAICGRIE